jgi:hypothetical protein
MAAYEWDDRLLPLFLLKVPPQSTVEEAKPYYDRTVELYRQGQKLAIIAHVAKVGIPDKAVTRYAAERMQQELALMRQQVLGTVFVTASPVFRFILSSLFLLQPLPFDHKVVSTLEEAIAWVEPKVAGAGLTLPAGYGEQARRFFGL